MVSPGDGTTVIGLYFRKNNHGLLKPDVGNRERWAGLTLMLDLARLYTALLVAFNLRWGCGLTTSRRSQWA